MFAHRLSMTFADKGEKLARAVAALTLHEGKTHYPSPHGSDWSGPEYALEPISTIRVKFEVNLKIALLILTADFQKHIPTPIIRCQSHRLSPLAALSLRQLGPVPLVRSKCLKATQHRCASFFHSGGTRFWGVHPRGRLRGSSCEIWSLCGVQLGI